VAALTARLGRPPRLLLAKPGLDGHSNGAEQIALRARDCGLEVIYEGIRRTPAEIVSAAAQEDPDVIGLSVLSGSHLAITAEIMARLHAEGMNDIPVVLGGIVPPDDAKALTEAGVARIYTPKDHDLNAIIGDLVSLVRDRA
jgi:(2R)-ethylmalonyl-CoA mutase